MMEKNILDGQVCRTDLKFRAVHMNVASTIYRLENSSYIIHCELPGKSFAEIEQEFEHKIRPVTLPVKLSNSRPLAFEAIVEKISDRDIPKNFEGVSMTLRDLYNLLLGKFPQINIYKVDDRDRAIKVFVYSYSEKTEMGVTKHFMSISDRGKLQNFTEGIGIGLPVEIIEEEFEVAPNLDSSCLLNPIQNINAEKLSATNVPEYAQRDEAIWFDKIEDIYEGSFKKSDLFFMNPGEYCCYIDYTTGGNIDIRNFLLLYKKIYISPPFEKDIRTWIREQKILEQEFIELIARGRICFLLTQHLDRYADAGLFQELHSVNRRSIVTRRAIAALQQIDIIELADNYILEKVSDQALIRQLAEVTARTSKIDANGLYDMMTWPIRARRSSFERLHWSGTFAIPSFGVNNFAGAQLKALNGKDYDFEFLVSANSIHLAHALNGTYFPYLNKFGFSDDPYAHIMGNFLNMFKKMTVDNLLHQETENGLSLVLDKQLSPIDVFEINDYIPILEFDDLVAEISAGDKSRQLMEYLAKLPPLDRAKKITEYNSAIEKHFRRKRRTKNALQLAGDAVLDGIGAATAFGATGIVYSLAKLGANEIKDAIPELRLLGEMITDKIHNTTDKKNIHFLTEINRVARVKRT